MGKVDCENNNLEDDEIRLRLVLLSACTLLSKLTMPEPNYS